MGKARTQKVDIYFNYVGLIDIAYTEEELAEMKAQEEQAEAERIARIKAKAKMNREKRKADRLAANGGEIVYKQVCKQCGKEFIRTSNHQQFCSQECKKTFRLSVLNDKRRAEKGNHLYKKRICKVCGKAYWPNSSVQTMCSDECRRKHHNEVTLAFYHKKQAEKKNGGKDLCKNSLQTIKPELNTSLSETITIPY